MSLLKSETEAIFNSVVAPKKEEEKVEENTDEKMEDTNAEKKDEPTEEKKEENAPMENTEEKKEWIANN